MKFNFVKNFPVLLQRNPVSTISTSVSPISITSLIKFLHNTCFSWQCLHNSSKHSLHSLLVRAKICSLISSEPTIGPLPIVWFTLLNSQELVSCLRPHYHLHFFICHFLEFPNNQGKSEMKKEIKTEHF